MSESPINTNVARDIVGRLDRAFGAKGAPHAAISPSDIEYLSRAIAELDWTRTERNMARHAAKAAGGLTQLVVRDRNGKGIFCNAPTVCAPEGHLWAGMQVPVIERSAGVIATVIGAFFWRETTQRWQHCLDDQVTLDFEPPADVQAKLEKGG